jgi:hypothetical protein
VDIHSFPSWLQQRNRERREHVPAADLVVPLAAQAGHAGMTRSEIGKAIGDGLRRETLDALLSGLVEFGLLIVTRENGVFVFRAAGNIPSRMARSQQ